jgi:uncharacterized membrane protein YraQ (UPF0718 family)
MKNNKIRIVVFVLFFLFIIFSFSTNFPAGKEIGKNYLSFLFQMLKVLPPVFILIGLFDVWVEREHIVKHLGEESGAISYLWAFILAMPLAGGLLPAFPIAYALYNKGARFTVLLTFLGAAGVGRIPMTLFEASFLGWQFSIIRLAISVPLVITGAIFMGYIFDKIGYSLPIKDE